MDAMEETALQAALRSKIEQRVLWAAFLYHGVECEPAILIETYGDAVVFEPDYEGKKAEIEEMLAGHKETFLKNIKV